MALIETTKGMLEESTLDKRVNQTQTGSGVSEATEYYLNGELVRRDVNFKFFPDAAPQ